MCYPVATRISSISPSVTSWLYRTGVSTVVVLTLLWSVTPSKSAESTNFRTQRGRAGRHLPLPAIPPSGSPNSMQIRVTSSCSTTEKRSRKSTKLSSISSPVYQRHVVSGTPSVPVSATDPAATSPPTSVVALDAVEKSSGERK